MRTSAGTPADGAAATAGGAVTISAGADSPLRAHQHNATHSLLVLDSGSQAGRGQGEALQQGELAHKDTKGHAQDK